MDALAQASPERIADRMALSLPFSRAKHISARLSKAIVNRAAPRAEGERAARSPGPQEDPRVQRLAIRRATPSERAPSR
jgi:hypothetical protein